MDWGGYRVLLELPIDPDEVHHFVRVVTVDMPLPTWGETSYHGTIQIIRAQV
jgi:hypothetical protein